jgi:hypothetical protein
VIKLAAAALALSVFAAPTADSCEVDAATLDWGFKESFRSYITGTIANGEWTLADGATYSTPEFGFADGAGTLTDGAGTVSFDGSIEFTGHGGILDTTISNPRLMFGDGAATLVLDVSGTTQAGDPVDAADVNFATIDLSGAPTDGRQFTVADAPARLTADGAAAFGTYEAGEALDPVSFTLDIDSACATQLTAKPADLEWLWLTIGSILVAGAVAVSIYSRRRWPRPQERSSQPPGA